MKFKNKWLKEIIDDDVCNDNPLEYVESTGWVGDGGKYGTGDRYLSTRVNTM